MKCCENNKDEIQKSMPSQYGFTLQELRDLMELRGDEARTKVEALGGPETIAQKLKTSTTNGINSDDTGNGSDRISGVCHTVMYAGWLRLKLNYYKSEP